MKTKGMRKTDFLNDLSLDIVRLYSNIEPSRDKLIATKRKLKVLLLFYSTNCCLNFILAITLVV